MCLIYYGRLTWNYNSSSFLLANLWQMATNFRNYYYKIYWWVGSYWSRWSCSLKYCNVKKSVHFSVQDPNPNVLCNKSRFDLWPPILVDWNKFVKIEKKIASFLYFRPNFSFINFAIQTKESELNQNQCLIKILV